MDFNVESFYELFLTISNKILPLYSSEDFKIKTKLDNSLVTTADIISDNTVRSFLEQFNFPIISEESVYKAQKSKYIWVIDPLDGTLDFIEKTGEFSILIGLLKDNRPYFGCIFRPTTKSMYFAQKRKGAFLKKEKKQYMIAVSKRDDKEKIMVLSRSHPNAEDNQVMKTLGIQTSITSGSLGLKLALLAEGKADVYLNTSNKTSIWDTCAGDVILHEAGGRITDVNGEPLRYNSERSNNEHGIIATNNREHEKVITAIKNVYKK